jgi:hypothetical protein
MTDNDTMDVLTGVALVASFFAFFAACVMLVQWWNATWRVAVDPIRVEIYSARIGQSPCLYRLLDTVRGPELVFTQEVGSSRLSPPTTKPDGRSRI